MYFIMYLSEHHVSMIHVVHVIDVMSKYELCPFFTLINKICLFNAKIFEGLGNNRHSKCLIL